MKINNNINLKDRSKITMSNFRGLDSLSPSVEVSAIHSTEMQNLIPRDGVNHKRYGWKTQFRIRDNGQYLKIQGIFNFNIFNENFLLVYAGKKFWLENLEYKQYIDITHAAIENNSVVSLNNTTISPVKDELLQDRECKFYLNGNKVYFIGCGDFLVFSKWDNGYFELRRVVGNEDVYIPTTTENIGSEEVDKEYTRISAEERNILSQYTYNLLFGRESMGSSDTATYYLDTNDFKDIEIEIQRKDRESVFLALMEEVGLYNIGEKIKNTEITLNNVEKSKTFTGKSILTAPRINGSDTIPNITLVTMENGDSLRLRFITENRTSRDYTHNNITVKIFSVDNSYYELLYINDDNTTVLKSGYCPIQMTVVCNDLFRLPEISGNGSTIYKTTYSFTITYKPIMENITFDLTQYNAVVSEMVNCSLKNLGSLIVKDKTNTYTGKVVISEKKLVLNGVENEENAYCPITKDTPNIKVKLKRNINVYELITSNKACEFGLNGSTDRLFIVGNSGNTIYWSKDIDFTYFGDKSWCVCGTSDKQITSLCRLNDSTLIAVKQYSIVEPSIYVISGDLYNGQSEAGTVNYKALFTPQGYRVDIGAVGDTVNFNGECLMVGNDGIYAITLGENMKVDSRYVFHRSKQISNLLEKFDLKSAKCVSYNGKFLIYVGGNDNEVYVADNKYVTTFQGDNQVNYEWWRWTNIPVSVFGFVNDELWFGTEDGQLCAFTKEFYDETFSNLRSGLINYEIKNGEIIGFSVNQDVNVEIGDIFTPISDFWGGLKTNNFEIIDNKTRFYLPLNDYTQNEIIIIGGNEYQIEKKDLYFEINYSTFDGDTIFYINYKNKPLTVIDNKSVVKLKDTSGNIPKWANVISNNGLNPAINYFKATLSNKKPVIAKWVSGATDLGTKTYSKSLTYITLTGEKDLSNKLKYGIKTRFTSRDYEILRANNDLNFDKIDLQTISMDSSFASSFAKKLNIRNINFLMFYFLSDTADDVSLNSVQIEFKLNKRNIGVR